MTDYNEIAEAECLLKHTEEQMKKKKGMGMIFTGGSGDGKSYAGLRFLGLWYKKWFNEEFPIKHVCNSVEEAIIIAKDIKRIGEGVLIEEISVHHGRREALTKKNILFNKFLDIVRIKQIVLVVNCPHISFVDKHLKMMFQSWVNCYKVSFKDEVVLAHPLWLQPFPHKDEPYKHRYLNKDGDALDFCYFKLPRKILLNQYDILKNKANEVLFDEIILKLRDDRAKQLEKLGQKVIPPRERQAYKLYLDGYTSKEAAKEMNLKNADTYRGYLKLAKKKVKRSEYTQDAKEIAKTSKKE